MSARRRRLILTGPAQDDIRALVNLGVTTWGDERSARYHADLADVLASLTSFPELGRPQVDKRAGIRSIAVNQHVVYYRHDEHTVTILRVLHGRMDATRHL
jgi:toxin ParE1/3/4